MMLFLFFFLPLVGQGEIYKWVDEKGNVYYGDDPEVPGAKELKKLPGLSTYSPPPLPPKKPIEGDEPGSEPTVDKMEPAAATPGYRQIRIVAPEDGATVRSSPGDVTVYVALDPVLRQGDYFKVLLDGRPLPARYSSTVILLRNVDRGEHKVAVAVHGKDGKKLLQSDAHTFYLHRTIARKPVPRG